MVKRYITILILVGLMFLSFFTGCNSKRITKDTTHEEALEILLYAKYNLEFQV